MRLRTFFIALLVLVVSIGQAQVNALVGKPAPPVVFQRSIGKLTGPEFYKGKILVLDFWATWCAPCIANFPHFNQLASKYQSKDVLFAIMTDEPLNTVQKFFARTKKEVSGLNVIDTSGATKKAFGLLFIPYSVVIDRNNIVRWAGLGQDLTPEILSSIINGDGPASNVKTEESKISTKVTAPKAVSPLFTFSVTPSAGGNSGGSGSTAKSGDILNLSRRNAQLGDVLEYVTGYSRNVRFLCKDTSRLSQKIDFNFDAKSDTLLFRKYANSILLNRPRRNMIVELLGDAMNFEARLIRKNQPYLELVVTDSTRLNAFKPLQNKHASLSVDHLPHFEIVSYTLKDMVAYLEGSAGMIIKTEIADKNEYDLSLDVTDLASLKKTLKFHGLGLVEKKGEVQYLDINFH